MLEAQKDGENNGTNSLNTTMLDTIAVSSQNNFHQTRLIADKLCLPQIQPRVARPRLLEHLSKSLQQFGSAIVCGRAGTGKTTLAADFARTSERAVAWYSVESADCDWECFLSYLIGCLKIHRLEWQRQELSELMAMTNGMEVSQITETLAGWLAVTGSEKPLLLVLDDVHCVFDAHWFGEFFSSFISALTPDVQLLMLSRSQPPLPLWRLRSKQMLGFTDEKLLAFTQEEAAQLFGCYGLSAGVAQIAHREAFGRVAKLEHLAASFSTNQSDFVI